jgi:hypothetical protein
VGKFGHKVACKYSQSILCARLDNGKDCVRYIDNYGNRRSYCKLLPESERKRLMDERSERCEFDNLPCKKSHGCFSYNESGRLISVCKRFITPEGFSVPKQLPQDAKDMELGS